MKPPTALPHEGPLFHEMMLEIDSKLAAEGHGISNRPLLAAREVSIRHQVAIPLTGPVESLPPELRGQAALGQAIRQWYDEVYGSRLKVDMNAGRTVIKLGADLYVLQIPRIFGTVEFHISRQFSSNEGIGRGVGRCNVVQLTQDLTQTKAMSLSDNDLNAIQIGFSDALTASYTLESTQHELMSIAKGDIATAIDCLMHKDERYGDSKWASLQAAEKILKAAIALQGATFKFTHGLEPLCAALNKAGVTVDVTDLLRRIQCRPGIRYGEESCDREEALAAHQASLTLVNRLRDAGAKFALGLG